MNRIKCEIFSVWAYLPDGLRRKPLDLEVCLLLIMVSLASFDISQFDPFDFLFIDSPFTDILQAICIIYIFIGSILILYGLFFHHRHNRILSYCKSEMWGWRFIFSASCAIFIAEFFFGRVTGVSLGSLLWFLQASVAMLKLLQYYNEKLKEKKLWIN